VLSSFVRGDSIVLERNPDYWGDEPAWDEIVLRPITNPGARVAALLAGDVDMIENPPTQDIERIEGSGFKVSSGLSNRVIYIALDQGDAPTPGISGDENPLQDAKVREALAKAINREAIRDRIMLGYSEPAGELLPPPMFGTNADREAIPFDEAAARDLLAEAGYEDGFQITLGTPNDRYINDGQIAQAVAQMWSRVGVQTEVDAKTFSAFISDRNAFSFSAFLAGWGAGTGEMSSPLTRWSPPAIPMPVSAAPTSPATPTRRWTSFWSRRCARWTRGARVAAQEASRVVMDNTASSRSITS
jgi:peptide/nickel transport system substrate-binding protein